MSSGDREIYAYETEDPEGMIIIRAPRERQWMDETDDAYAYRCLPLLMANQNGWFVTCPATFTVWWTGGTGKQDLQIEFLSGKADRRIASHFGHGVLTFSLPYLFRTPEGINLLVKGPSNWIKDGIQALEGIVETDWNYSTFTMNWKLTRPDCIVHFEAGDPICMIVPLPRSLSEHLLPLQLPLAGNTQLEAEFWAWERNRAQFLSLLAQNDSRATKEGWQRDYFKGRNARREVFPKHQVHVLLKEFVRSPSCADNRLTTIRNPSKPIAKMRLPYLKESFLCEDECAALIRLIERYAKREPNLDAMVCTERRTEIAARFVHSHGLAGEAELLARIRLRCQSEIEAYFALERPIYPEFMMLQGNYPGDGHVRHADNRQYDKASNKWIPNHTPQRVITSIVYLNRCGSDFTGGELVFPALDRWIAPSPGLFIAYPSDERFEHEVPPVQSGARYSLLLWFTDEPAFAEATFGSATPL